MGVKIACSLVELISNEVKDMSFHSIEQFDIIIKKCLEDKNAVTNVLTACSYALTKASAELASRPLFLYIYESINKGESSDRFFFPQPCLTVLEGGMHSKSPLVFESVFLIPKTGLSFVEQMRTSVEIAKKLKTKLFGNSNYFQIGKSGGYVIDNLLITGALSLVEKTIVESGFSLNTDFTIGIDFAATSFYDQDHQRYQLEPGVDKSSAELIQFYVDLITEHPCTLR